MENAKVATDLVYVAVRRRLFAVSWFFCAAVLVFSLAACVNKSTRPRGTPASNVVDESHLLQSLLHQQREAVDLAKSCLAKTQRPQLITFCGHVSEDHEATARQLEVWLSDWYPGIRTNAAAGHSSEQFRAIADKMQSQSGSEFDKTFLRALRVHHRQGREIWAMCRASAAPCSIKGLLCL